MCIPLLASVRPLPLPAFAALLGFLLLVPATATFAEEENGEQIEIAGEPTTIDPAALLPDELARKVTMAFDRALIDEVADRLTKEHDLTVLVDRQQLDESGFSLGEPITESLRDEPLYLLLDRLAALGVGWFRHDDHIELTSAEAVEERMVLKEFHVGELVDAGFTADELTELIVDTIAPDEWDVHSGSTVKHHV